MKFFLTQDHMGLEISERYSYSFQLISTKFHDKYPCDGGTLAVASLDDLWNIKQFMTV